MPLCRHLSSCHVSFLSRHVAAFVRHTKNCRSSRVPCSVHHLTRADSLPHTDRSSPCDWQQRRATRTADPSHQHGAASTPKSGGTSFALEAFLAPVRESRLTSISAVSASVRTGLKLDRPAQHKDNANHPSGDPDLTVSDEMHTRKGPKVHDASNTAVVGNIQSQ